MSLAVKTITLKNFFSVNCYLIKTDSGYVLIDASFASRRDQLEHALSDAGCEPGNLALIVLTHGDPDHVGNAAYLREKYGAKIALHRADWEMVEHGDMSRNRGVKSMYQRMTLQLVRRLMPFKTFTPDIALEEGDTLVEYGLDAQIIHLPGHSKGNSGLLTVDGDLFCGDLLANTNGPEVYFAVDEMAAQTSAEKLKSFTINTVYPGHGKPFPMATFLQSLS